MGEGFQFLDIVLFAAVAAFLILRLRGVLGRRTGHDQFSKNRPLGQNRQNEAGQETVGQLADRAKAPTELGTGKRHSRHSPVEAGLAQIKLADRSFNVDDFLNGARRAFEIIISAFSDGDVRALRPLLSNDVYEEFCGAIKSREKAKQTLETTIVGVTQSEITEAEVEGRTAFITVKFVSDQINILRDDRSSVVEGDSNKVKRITDLWTFARNTHSRDPNWTLVATNSNN
jgi:predicted lipid-binding transport protein (Tim44 family)